jgi:F-type H+-transporting ATPase subunit epsilon
MHLEILTPDKSVFSGKIKSVTLPGTKSPFTVLKNHAPVISTLDKGELGVETDNGDYLLYTIEQGVVEVRENKIVVLIEKIKPSEL